MSCINPILIPDINCDPVFSAKRIPSYLPAKLDAGDIVEIYDFMPEDIDINWVSEVYDLSSPETEPTEAEDCDVGSDLVTESAETPKYISLLKTAVDAAGAGRTWIAPLSCKGSSGDDDPESGEGDEDTYTLSAGLAGAAHFANPRVRNISFPTFIPRSGGGSRPIDDEGLYNQCGLAKITIVVKESHNSGITLVAGSFVNYKITSTESTAVCYPFSDRLSPMGVLLERLDEKEKTWCCLVSGFFRPGSGQYNGLSSYAAIGSKYSPGAYYSIRLDAAGKLMYLGTARDGDPRWLLEPSPDSRHDFTVLVMGQPTDSGATIAVTRGNFVGNYNDILAGTLNGKNYYQKKFEIKPNTQYYVYAIEQPANDRLIALLTHEFNCNITPVLLIAKVKLTAGVVNIDQISLCNSPIVAVAPSAQGDNEIHAVFNYNGDTNSLETTYTADITAYKNYTKITTEDPITLSPSDVTGYIYAAVAKDEETLGVSTHIIAGSDLELDSVVYYTQVASYKYLRSTGINSFVLDFLNPPPYMLTFVTTNIDYKDL